MASPYIFTGGLGGSTGDALATYANLASSGQVWYVHYATGTDAVSPAGLERSRPLQTIAQAYTNASAGDIIVLLSNHAETLTATQTLGKAGLRLISEGTGSSNMATFTPNLTNAMFSVTAAGVLLGNIAFAAPSVATSNAAVSVTGARVVLRNCRFTPNQNANAAPLSFGSGGDGAIVSGCTFVGSAAAASDPPYAAISNAAAISDLTIDDVTIDGGTYGWSTYAIELASAVTRLTVTNLDLLNGSDLHVATGSVYTVHVANKSGNARVVLDS